MFYQKKDLFTERHIKPDQRIPIQDATKYPPDTVKWKSEVLFLLGESNKKDLLNEHTFITAGDEEVVKAFGHGMVKQFMYTNNSAELFEIAIMQSESNLMYIVAIRTRRKAEK